MSLRTLWRDLSVSKKLYIVVGVMAILIATELFTLLFAMNVLSSVRGFVGGEGLWSKAQKDAVLNLHAYARTRDPKYFDHYLENLKVPLGDRAARHALEKPNPDLGAAADGFIQGRNHPDDVESLIQLLVRFHKVEHLSRAIGYWQDGDRLLSDLMIVGNELHQKISGGASRDQVNAILERIDQLNDQLTVVEDQFSYTLGEGSRWLEHLLMVILAIAVLTIESTGLILTVSFSRALSKGLRELNEAADEVGQGHFDIQVPVRSGDELGQLAQGINQMARDLQKNVGDREHAESASKIKSLFLANMSHEIRTPLSVIVGFTELLLDPDITPEEHRQYLQVIQRMGSGLTKIINDILDLSKVEAGRLEIETVDFSLNELLIDLKLIMELKASEKNLHFTIAAVGEVPDRIHSDPLRLRQILVNIVGNAIKFTEHGSVHLSYQLKDSQIIFKIKDSGPGLTHEQAQLLFESFSQVDNTMTRKHEGSGLGLVISRRLARILGGDVRLVESTPGGGSTFEIQVAYEPPQTTSLRIKYKNDERDRQPLLRKHILIAEDLAENRILLHRMLTKLGAEVQFSVNGQDAISRALNEDFDLLLMDIQMPIMDGYTATRHLRSKGYKKPIVALSANAMKEDHIKSIEAGCNHHLTKPIRSTDLRDVVYYYCTQDLNGISPK